MCDLWCVVCVYVCGGWCTVCGGVWCGVVYDVWLCLALRGGWCGVVLCGVWCMWCFVVTVWCGVSQAEC